MIPNFYPTNFYSYFTHKKSDKSPFDSLKNLKQLADTLTSVTCDMNQWMLWKRDIQTFLSSHLVDEAGLDDFLMRITEWGVERDLEKTMAIIGEVVGLDALIRVISFKQKNSNTPFNIHKWAAENVPCDVEFRKSSGKVAPIGEWKRYRPIVLYFIPNLINIFIGAFNFLDPQKKFTTLWEKYLLLDIIYKFLMIPSRLANVLQPTFKTETKSYLVAAVIIAATGLLISFYQRWLRPLPDNIVHCTNLDRHMEKGFIQPKIGQEIEIKQLITALGMNKNVLLIGRAGEGKTALMHHLIQLKFEKKLPENLQKLSVYELRCGEMISHMSYGHSELINHVREQIDGHEDQIILFFDEFYQVATNPSAFLAFKKRFLEDEPRAKFVATMTLKELNKLQTLDEDGSFMSRIFPMIIRSSDHQTRLVIEDFVRREIKDLIITDDAIETLLKISSDENNSPEIGLPRKAIKILTDAIGLCRAAYDPHYVPSELSELRQAQEQYEALTIMAIRHVKEIPEVLERRQAAKEKIQKFSKQLDKDKNQLKKIRKIIDQQQQTNDKYFKLADRLVQEDSITQHEQSICLWYYFYALDAIKKVLQVTMNEVSPEIPVQVDAKLINHVYRNSKEIETSLLDKVKK